MEFDWNDEVLGNTLRAYAQAFGGALVVTLLVVVAIRLASWRLRPFTENGAKSLPLHLGGQALRSTRLWLVVAVALSIALYRLEISDTARPWLRTALVAFLLLQLLFWGNRALTAWREYYDPGRIESMGARYTTMRMFIFFGRIVFWVIGALIILDNIPGVQITALVASLGIGGIAVALALQSILTDIFASLTITLDRPFVIGDFIIVGDQLGTVEHIGLKTTRLRSLSGEQLVFSNNDLLTSRVRNFKRLRERRVAFDISVTYDTALELLREIPGRIRAIIEKIEDVRFDRAHFRNFGTFALEFEIVYFVLGADYALYMDRQQSINLAIKEYFESAGIGFAFPTHTIQLDGGGDAGEAMLIPRVARRAASAETEEAGRSESQSQRDG